LLNYCAQPWAAANLPYGVAEGDAEGDGEVSLFFLVVSFLVVVDSFLVASVVASFLVDDFLVADFLVVVEAGAFSGAVVVVDSLLVVHELMSPAANRTVME
jgi:hypothetical protein